MSSKKLLVVLGMHRSGTSVLTRGLQVLGATLGGNLMAPIPQNNEKGFWEDLDIYHLNESLLAKADSAWHCLGKLEVQAFLSPEYATERRKASQLLTDRLAGVDIFAFKDPRTAILLPFWQSVFKDIGVSERYIIALRNPLEIAASLRHRDGFELTKGLMLWAKHVIDAVQYTNGKARVFVSFDRLLDNPEHELSRIAQTADLPLPDTSGAPFKEFSEEFLESRLRHEVMTHSDAEISRLSPAFVSNLERLVADWALMEVGSPDKPDTEHWRGIKSAFDDCASLLLYADDIESRRAEAESRWADTVEANSTLERVANALEAEKNNLEVKLVEERNKLISAEQNLANTARELTEWRHKTNEEIQNLRSHQATSDNELIQVREQIEAIRQSTSWRLTAPLRWTKFSLKQPTTALRTAISFCVHKIWRYVPLSTSAKRSATTVMFTAFPFFFRWSASYKMWRRSANTDDKEISTKCSKIGSAPIDGYVPLRAQSAPVRTEARAIAFYLPQFHAIPENDEWWGEGFTEWMNVRRATPQFEGHNQPNKPGELSYYDLVHDANIRKRQAELASLHGLSGFCFYFYWFAGERLLEQPIADFADDPEIDFPFCLCWANENWSRRWDGLSDHILISQDHSPEDDIEFISYISRYLASSKYIRINGKPLLVVYRPALLPDAAATAARWRDWCRGNGIGEIYLAYTQSFESVDPSLIGFDAAIEFPPNNAGLVEDHDFPVSADKTFAGKIYDWTALHQKSTAYEGPAYTLFRGVNPQWDNTPRRMSEATILNGSTPQLYSDWLANAAADTKERFTDKDERLIFINAWNEWAEGAYLEPDQLKGYAWLEATRRALAPNEQKIIVVTHDLHKHGAQYLALNMARTLKTRFGYEVAIIAGEDGALHQDFSVLGPVLIATPANAQKVIADLSEKGFSKAIVNSAASGWISQSLANAGVRFVGLVHELQSIIEAMNLHSNLSDFDRHACRVIFPSRAVRDRDQAATGINWQRPTILPQGLYKTDSIGNLEEKENARKLVLSRLNLPDGARIILGAGHADHRKGIDIFIKWALKIAAKRSDTHSIWIGKIDAAMKPVCDELLGAAGHAANNIHFPGFVEDTRPFYAAADIYALTSREDPFPSTALEALAGGAPVVMIGGAGGIEDLVDQECVTALGDPAPESFVRAAIPLLGAESSMRGKMGLIGRDLIRADFGFASYMGDLMRLLGEPCPKISVVVPNYNYAAYIEQRLHSILNQTLPPWEIIFLDDASTDDSVDIAERILASADVRYRIVRNKQNSGSVFAQWRKGAELARGDFIWIAEADDWADSVFLEAAATPLAADNQLALSFTQSNQANSEGKVACSDYLDYVSDVDPGRWRQGYSCDGHVEIREGLSVKNTIPNVSAVVFRTLPLRCVLNEKHDEISRYRVAGDWFVHVNVLRHGGAVFDPRPLNYHRRHDNSVTISRFGLEEFAEISDMQAYVAREFETNSSMREKAGAYLDHLIQEYKLIENHGAKAVANARAKLDTQPEPFA